MKLHGGYRRKDYKGGDQQGADEVHCQNDDHCNKSGDHKVISPCFYSGSLCKVLVKCDREDLVVKKEENDQDCNGKDNTQHDILSGESQDRGGTEQGSADIRGDICGGGRRKQVHKHISYCKRRYGYHSD